MKVIVIHASAGAGHFKAAQALYKYLRENRPSLEIGLIDALEYVGAPFRLLYTAGYSLLIRRLKPTWNFAFRITAARPLCSISRFMARFSVILNSRRLLKLLEKENPDFIISTHFLPSDVATYLKRKGRIKSKIITVITDFGVHPFWVSAGVDIYAVAATSTRDELLRQGVAYENIIVSGIPINPRFFKVKDRQELRRLFNIREGIFTVLIMTGSFGIGPIEEIVDMLSEDIHLIVVCASNKALLERLRQKKRKNLSVFGFVDNVEELMKVSDMIITKAGGMSIAEFLVMQLVPIFISVIPGQEEENVRILKNYGIGFTPGDLFELRDTVNKFSISKAELEKAKIAISFINNPDAAKEICNALR